MWLLDGKILSATGKSRVVMFCVIGSFVSVLITDPITNLISANLK